MKNFRIHEALCRLFPDAPVGSWMLEQGTDTGGEIAITAWNLLDPKPTQEQLDRQYGLMEEEEREAAHQRVCVAVRQERDRLLREQYDAATMRIGRKLRSAPVADAPRWEAAMAAWDAYAVALCNLPGLPGFPWGGDMAAVPWPEAPRG